METLVGTVPDGWRERLLGDMCRIIAGPSSNILRSAATESGGVPVVAPKNIGHGRITVDGLDQVTAAAASDLSRYLLAPGDIVCSRTGELGRHALVGVEHAGWLLGTTCVLVRPESDVLPAYLNRHLSHPATQDWIDRHGSGSAIPSMSIKTLGLLPVVLPPMAVQTSISKILDVLDEKILIHEAISSSTTELRDTLLPLLMTGLSPA